MRIRIIIPYRSPMHNEEHLRDASRFKAPDTEIEVVSLKEDPQDPARIFSCGFDEALILEQAVQAETDGCDGVFISCFGGPALDAARGRLRIPVVDGFQPAALTASLVSTHWSIVTLRRELLAAIRLNARKLGIEASIASMRVIGMTVVEDEEVIEQRLFEAIEAALEEDGAEAIVLGCTGFTSVSRSLGRRLAEKGKAVPIIDPVAAAIGYLELLVRGGLSQSPLAYGFFGEDIHIG